MRKDTMKFLFYGVMGGILLCPLSGCFQKTVKVDPAEMTAVVEDTVGGKSSPGKAAGPETAPIAKVDSSTINEAAGPAESLESPFSGQDGSSSMSGVGLGATEVVKGSRTNVGLLPVYFDFDKAIIRPDQVERIAANALFLKNNPGVKVRIEGNSDCRGSNEYNLALGERRAMGAKRYLVNLGIIDGRVSVLSYGEERPVNPGNDETAWAENRRGDFVVIP